MKKLFVSVPTEGRALPDICKSVNKMQSIAELLAGEVLEHLPVMLNDDAPKDANADIWHLSKSIEALSYADYFIGIEETWEWEKCRIEASIARYYDIKMFEISAECISPDLEEHLSKRERERRRQINED